MSFTDDVLFDHRMKFLCASSRSQVEVGNLELLVICSVVLLKVMHYNIALLPKKVTN